MERVKKTNVKVQPKRTAKVQSKKIPKSDGGFLKGIDKYKKAALGVLGLLGVLFIILKNGKKEMKFIPLGAANNKGYEMLESMVKKSSTGKSQIIDEYLIYKKTINEKKDPYQKQEQSSGISHDLSREGLGYSLLKSSSRMSGTPVKFVKKK